MLWTVCIRAPTNTFKHQIKFSNFDLTYIILLIDTLKQWKLVQQGVLSTEHVKTLIVLLRLRSANL